MYKRQGSVDYHLSAPEAGRDKMRSLLDQLHPVYADYDAIVSTASGCGATLKEYAQILPVSYTHLTLPTNREV